MSYTWQTDPAASQPDLVAENAAGWASQEEAEDWLGEVHADLWEDGVRTVVLSHDGVEVYSMSLEAENSSQ